MKGPVDKPLEVPVVVAGKDLQRGRKVLKACDPNQLPETVVVARCALAAAGDAKRAVETAKADPDGWRTMTFRRRHRILCAAADEIRRARGDLIGAAAASTGKLFTEADPEVSEAVDFAEFYPHAARAYFEMKNLRCRGKGVGLVIAPWNFPIAIPCGGIAAALSAGNTVIFKPSSDAILVGWLLCQCFWRAGVSKNTLQFLPCEGGSAGAQLASHPDVDFVILTGGTETGLKILEGPARPAADSRNRRQERHRGHRHVRPRPGHRRRRLFGLRQLRPEMLGHLAADPGAGDLRRRKIPTAARRMPPPRSRPARPGTSPPRWARLIRPPRSPLQEALCGLEPGESWALEPKQIGGNPHLWSPGIKWGVPPGSQTHLTEFFGPLLGVMRAENLKQAVDLVNQTGYGLTSGIESLDRREQAFWQERVKAGNLYINRGTTGAIVLRQPFGGMGKSALGAGIKAGGPHYVTQFLEAADAAAPSTGPLTRPHRLLRLAQRWQLGLDGEKFGAEAGDIRKTILAIRSYLYHVEREFGRELDHVNLRGQDNLLRHLPVGTVAVRLHPADTLFDALARIAAVKATGNRLRVSVPTALDTPAARFLYGPEGLRLTGRDPVFQESDVDLIAGLPTLDRIRYAAPGRVPPDVFAASAATGFYIARAPVVMEGRIELLQYYRQQSVCTNYHRYGNLGFRAGEFSDD